MRVANVTMGKLLSPLLVIFRNKIHQCYEMWPLDDKTEGTQSVSIVISTLIICDMQFPLWYEVSTMISTAICHMQFLHTVICTDAIVPLAAGGGGAVRSNLKIGIFIGEKRRRPFGQIRPRCSTLCQPALFREQPLGFPHFGNFISLSSTAYVWPYFENDLLPKNEGCESTAVGLFLHSKDIIFFKIQDIHWKKHSFF